MMVVAAARREPSGQPVAVACCISIATRTRPLVLTAMLKTLSRSRRGRRATSRVPSRSGAGKRVENLITPSRRRGRRAESVSAATVLWRAARIAGTKVATIATPTAMAVTIATVVPVTLGAPAAPSRPAPGPSTNGAASHPMTRPTMAAHRPTSTCSNRSTTATSQGVPPIAFNRPTRRVCSAIRPPTRTATLASASSASNQLPVIRTVRIFASVSASPARMLCHGIRVGAVGEVLELKRLANAGAASGSLSFRFKK